MAFGGIAYRPSSRIAVAAIALCAFAACASSSRSADARRVAAPPAAPQTTTSTPPPAHPVVRRVRKAAVKKAATTTSTTTTTIRVVHRYVPPPVMHAPAPVHHVYSPPVAIASAPQPAPAPAPSSSAAESQLVSLINGFRHSHGLGSLSVHSTLVSKARSWAAHMASGGCGMGGNGLPLICHSNLSSDINVQWSVLEENVGMCSPRSNVSGMESAFENSPMHAANMLSTKIHYVGVGFAYVGNYMYVAEEFMG